MTMLDWAKAKRALGSQPLQAVYTCVGTEWMLVEAFVRAVAEQLSREVGEPIQPVRFSFDDGGLDAALLACQSLSLFAARQLVVLTQVSAAAAARAAGGRNPSSDAEALERYLEQPQPENVLIVCVPYDKLDERRKLVKRLKAHVVVDCTPPKEAGVRAAVRQLAEDSGIRVDADALAELCRRCPSVTQAAVELDKLWTYTDGQTIELPAVEAVTPLPVEDNVFHWMDGVVTGDAARVFRSLADVQRAGHDPFSLYGLLVRQLRLMWYARTLGDQGAGPKDIAAAARAHPYAVQVAARQAQGVAPRVLEDLLTVVADAEFAVKSGQADPLHALERVLATCALRLRRSRGPGRAVGGARPFVDGRL